MGESNALEFFGAFICWMFTGFRGKLDNHYSNGYTYKQVINIIIGLIAVIAIGTSIAVVKAKISGP